MIESLKKGLKKYTGLIAVIFIGILLYRVITEINFKSILDWAATLLKPFIIGVLIAYILNPIVRFFDEKVFAKAKILENKKKLTKTLSMIITYVLVGLIVYFIIRSIMPEIISSIQNVASALFTYIPKIEAWLNRAFNELAIREGGAREIVNAFKDSINAVFDAILQGVQYVPGVMSKVVSGTFNVAGWLFNFVIGIIISLYLLLDKNNLIDLCKKTFFLMLPESGYKSLRDFVVDANNTFESFFIGKVIDSAIIAVIFFLGCIFISPDYALLFACVIGVTNIIPYFGPFIGGVPVVILCLMQNPYSAIWMTIFIFMLQQFDGYILGPRILGDSIGIKPLGVIFSILIGGGLFGVLGMFFGVPVFAVISRTYGNFINKRIDKRLADRQPSYEPSAAKPDNVGEDSHGQP